jgi:hypothetical protein
VEERIRRGLLDAAAAGESAVVDLALLAACDYFVGAPRAESPRTNWTPRPSPRTHWTRRVPRPVLTGPAASPTPYQSDTPRPALNSLGHPLRARCGRGPRVPQPSPHPRAAARRRDVLVALLRARARAHGCAQRLPPAVHLPRPPLGATPLDSPAARVGARALGARVRGRRCPRRARGGRRCRA